MYVGGNPVNLIDPLGLESTSETGGIPIPVPTIPLPGTRDENDPSPSKDIGGVVQGCYNAIDKMFAKEVPKSALGPSGKPKIHNVDHPNRKLRIEVRSCSNAFSLPCSTLGFSCLLFRRMIKPSIFKSYTKTRPSVGVR